ncbi:helix-turn-helix transcriptional regulator [Roseateles sp. NT4]|uniref:helix-turn-helix transcriptional regulator n=1 Tax=Roseateles sp. NT4 TaxID=3453715 RepID=UPI003EEFE75D
MSFGEVQYLHTPFERRRSSRADPPKVRYDPRFGDSLLSACQQIESEPTRSGQLQLLKTQLLKIGFDWAALGRVDGASGLARANLFSFELAHQRWTSRYFRRGYAACDARLIAFAHSNLPYVWNLRRLRMDGAKANVSPPLLDEFVSGLEADGLRSGVFFGIPDVASNLRCFVSFSSKEADCAWIDGACVGAALTLGMSLGSVLGQREGMDASDADAPSGVDMSATQRNIIGCLVNGMSDKQIAYTLGLSRHNVDYHMRRLRSKYGARNRVQLAQQIGKAIATKVALPDLPKILPMSGF